MYVQNESTNQQTEKVEEKKIEQKPKNEPPQKKEPEKKQETKTKPSEDKKTESKPNKVSSDDIDSLMDDWLNGGDDGIPEELPDIDVKTEKKEAKSLKSLSV